MWTVPRRVLAPLAAATLAAAVAAVAIAIASPATAATLFSDDFEDGNSSGWSTSGGTWAVTADGTQVLRQSGTSSDARARGGTATWTDYTVTARVKPTAINGANRFVALLARAQSTTSYYYLALRSNNTVELKKLVGGSATTLATGSVVFTTNSWYTLSLDVSGTTLRGSVNNGTPLVANDSQFVSGQVGVATFNAAANFDDITVTSGTPGSPSPSPSTSRPPSPSPSTSPSPPGNPPGPGQPDGFASVNALGQNGTTGGAGGPTVVVDTTDELLTAIDTIGAMVIEVHGTINITSKQGVRPNKTIIGAAGATINGGGFDFYKSFNVIVRNLTFTNAEDDAVNVGQNSHHIWVDHNTFRGAIDGSIDIVRGAEYVTVSWNHFDHSDKTMLIGHSDGSGGEDIGHLKVTIHHNFFDNSRQRHPRVRWGDPVHVYNNYFLANELYGVASTQDGGVLLEGNYFANVPFPCFSASGYADSGPGRLVQRNNVFTGSGACEVNGSVADPRSFYAYAVDNPSTIPTLGAGRGGGRTPIEHCSSQRLGGGTTGAASQPSIPPTTVAL